MKTSTIEPQKLHSLTIALRYHDNPPRSSSYSRWEIGIKSLRCVIVNIACIVLLVSTKSSIKVGKSMPRRCFTLSEASRESNFSLPTRAALPLCVCAPSFSFSGKIGFDVHVSSDGSESREFHRKENVLPCLIRLWAEFWRNVDFYRERWRV